jgi:spermidine/putrescine transport system permease protein
MVFLYLPIVVLITLSFNDSKLSSWNGFTLRWYLELFKDKQIISALYSTITVAAISSFVATVIGSIAAIGIYKMDRAFRGIVLQLTNIPILNPDIVTGLSLMILYVFVMDILRVGNFGFLSLILSHIAFNIPYVVLSILPRLRQLDKNIYEAALDLGAGHFFALKRVIIPEIMPGIVTGILLAFTLSIDDFVISFFTTGPGVTNLSIMVYSMARKGVNPKINALSTLMFLSVLILLYVVNMRSKTTGKIN